MNYSVSSEAPRGPINVSELEGIREAILAAKGTPNYEVLKAQYEGPDSGLDFVEETGELKIASTWHVDENGYIVRN